MTEATGYDARRRAAEDVLTSERRRAALAEDQADRDGITDKARSTWITAQGWHERTISIIESIFPELKSPPQEEAET